MRVYVIIERVSGRGHPRVVAKLPARGTRHWTLDRRLYLGPGRYVIVTDPVDALGQHQLPSNSSEAIQIR